MPRTISAATACAAVRVDGADGDRVHLTVVGALAPSGSAASTPAMNRDWSRRSIIACLCAASLLGEGDVGPVESTV